MQGTAAIPDFSPDSSIAAPARQASKSWTRFGVALFDGMEPGPGWTAIDDEPDKVRRIEDITQLRNDVLWWTNIPYETFQEAQLQHAAWIKSSAFLRVSPIDVLEEWGVSDADPERRVEILVRFFSRLLQTVIEASPDVTFSQYSLQKEIGDLLDRGSFPIRNMMFQVTNAVQEMSFPVYRRIDNARPIRFRFPRLSYFRRMLKTRVPVGEWLWTPVGRMGSDPISYLMGCERPFLAEVTITGRNDDANIFAWGAGSREQGEPIKRTWCSDIELPHLLGCSTVQIKEGAYIGSGFMDWDPFVTPPMKTLKERLESAATPVSWTAGLLAESVWQAASSKGKANKRSREQYQYSFRAAWLKIADRMHLYEAARSLASKGHATSYYGGGFLRVTVPPEQVSQAIRDAFALGMLPPVSALQNLPESLNISPRHWGGAAEFALPSLLHILGHRAVLFELDALPVNLPPDMARQKIAELIQPIIQKK